MTVPRRSAPRATRWLRDAASIPGCRRSPPSESATRYCPVSAAIRGSSASCSTGRRPWSRHIASNTPVDRGTSTSIPSPPPPPIAQWRTEMQGRRNSETGERERERERDEENPGELRLQTFVVSSGREKCLVVSLGRRSGNDENGQRERDRQAPKPFRGKLGAGRGRADGGCLGIWNFGRFRNDQTRALFSSPRNSKSFQDSLSH